ncbi:MAG TPA: TetR/AcrR family transcriptional regulator, partial [Caulobacterales bacterium]|nr:TetR/AcrR family transcriptional regulator [Caulobacterales bacterium]
MDRGAAAARRKRAPKKSRRDQLLDEAARQLNARGVSLTSLTDVADQLGVSRAALYYYVDDREDLVFQVYRRSCEILARHLGESARSEHHALDVVREFVASTLDPDEPEIAALSELGLLRPAERETIMALYEGVVARLAYVLEAGAGAGEIRPCDFTIAARCIISMIYWTPLSVRWTMAASPVTRAQVINQINDVLAFGSASDRTKIVDPPRIDLSPLIAPKVAAFARDALSDAKREIITLTASRMFNAKGVDTTSLEEIAAELGATKRTLYHYVGDKQALISACYDRAYRIYFFLHDTAAAMDLSVSESTVAATRAYAEAQQRKDLSPLRPLVGF